jgi:hypothetical protein
MQFVRACWFSNHSSPLRRQHSFELFFWPVGHERTRAAGPLVGAHCGLKKKGGGL